MGEICSTSLPYTLIKLQKNEFILYFHNCFLPDFAFIIIVLFFILFEF